MVKTILVVDDEPDIRQSVKMILEKNSYSVITAEDGDECLKKIKEIKPDLILLDIMMPGIPVTEILKKIKDIKIVFLSVIRISDARKKGLTSQDNVIDFLQKPFNVNELINRVKILIGN
jgi:two-component system alkaline phosphatase synthesis response regulator PhoP